MTYRRCENCEFAVGPTAAAAPGYECHLNPPAAWRENRPLRVKPDDWCGRFRPRDRGYIPDGNFRDRRGGPPLIFPSGP